MAITLAEMKVGMDDKVSKKVVDIFLQKSELLQLLPFDNCISPSGGSTLTYSYVQELLPSVASFRALNTEYTANHATLQEKTATLKIFGGSFDIDRVLNQAGGKYNNIAFQMRKKVDAAVSLFHYTVINGDATTRSTEFDGLDKMLAGQATEFGADTSIDISTAAALKTNADQLYEALMKLITDTEADALLCNGDMLGKIQTLARLLGYKTETEEAFGRKVVTMDGVRLMNLGSHYTVSDAAAVKNPIVKKGLSRTIGSTATTGLTDVYAVKFGVEDAFHGISLTGSKAVKAYMPDFEKPGAVKKGEVEMIAATALKNTAHAGVLRNIKIA